MPYIGSSTGRADAGVAAAPMAKPTAARAAMSTRVMATTLSITTFAACQQANHRLVGSSGRRCLVLSFTEALNCIARYGHPDAVFHCETTKPKPPTTPNRDAGNT